MLRDMRNNRQLNTAMYLLAFNQLRWNAKAKAYFEKKIAEGKTKRHALRCLMRINANIVYGMLKSGEPYRA
jgi:transposase